MTRIFPLILLALSFPLHAATCNDGILEQNEFCFGMGSPRTIQDSGRVIAHDMDGDGKLDFAVAHTFNNEIRFGFGDGTGSFPTQSAHFLASSANSLSAGDFLGIGQLDIAWTQPFSQVSGILWAKSLWTSDTIFPMGPLIVEVESADLDNDGDADKIVLFKTGFLVMLSDGIGGFTPFSFNYPAGVTLTDLDLGDFNEDGFLDIIHTFHDGVNPAQIFLLTNAGPGNYVFSDTKEPEVGTRTLVHMTVNDFNGDGHLDVGAVADFKLEVSDDVVHMTGDGNGHWVNRAGMQKGVTFSRIYSEDMDQDGDQDMVTVHTKGVHIYSNRGNGWQMPGIEMETFRGGQCHDIALGDFNEDGFTDMLQATDHGTYLLPMTP